MTRDYIAGFFDADGYITMCKMHKNEEPQPSVGFTNNVLFLLQDIQKHLFDAIGVKGLIRTKKAKKKNHKESYDLRFEGRAKSIAVLTYLEIKHPKKCNRLRIAIKLGEVTPRNGRYSKEQLKERRRLCKEFILTQG